MNAYSTTSKKKGDKSIRKLRVIGPTDRIVFKKRDEDISDMRRAFVRMC